VTKPPSKLSQWFEGVLQWPRLGLWLTAASLLLSASALFLGFHLDDHVGRYIYSDLPGAQKLFGLYEGGYGLANGNPADTHWQIEAGWAPWWTYDHLLIRLFRPIGVLTHWLDFRLYPTQAWLMHLHNLLWLALLVAASTRMYRSALGTKVGGLAALLFAFDHTHGFVVGYICNRHALITALFGVLCLDQHLRAYAENTRRRWLLAYVLYALALCSGESTIAILGYLIAHVLCVDESPLLRRALRVAPYLIITVLWRAAYTRAGYGAVGSGLYIDPGREPVTYLIALLQRTPILLLGQYLGPPAEMHVISPPPTAAAILVLAWIFTVALAVGLWPVVRRYRSARFWLLGALISLVPAASTYPHNRQLLFTSFGAMALLAQLWQLHVIDAVGARQPLLVFSRGLGALLMFSHVIVSPLVMPIATFGIAATAQLDHTPDAIGDELADRDAVFIDAPDYFSVKLIQLERRIDQRPLPRRWRALSFGSEHITLQRTGPAQLELEFAEGILSTPFMELYRDRRLAMHRGERIELAGLGIEVVELTEDQRAKRVRYDFDQPLESSQFKFYYWNNNRYEPFVPPAVGGSRQLPVAKLELKL
jgi:hypothetical protein